MNGDNFFKKSKLGLAISGKMCYPIKVDTRDTHHPGVAQLVARLTGGQEAVSSSLATRTNEKSCNHNGYRIFCCLLEAIFPLVFPLQVKKGV